MRAAIRKWQRRANHYRWLLSHEDLASANRFLRRLRKAHKYLDMESAAK